MPTTPATSFLLDGTVTAPPTSALYMRLCQPGPVTQFVEFLLTDIADLTLGPFPPNSKATELVNLNSNLHFSDYPLPGPVIGPVEPIGPIHPIPVSRFAAPASAPGPGPTPTPGPGPKPTPIAPIGPIHPIPIPVRPEGFVGNDGTPITVKETSGQITQLSGESKDNHNYVLTLETFSSSAADVAPNLKPWCGARMSVTDNGDDPLQFGIAYCPLEQQFDIFLERANVSIGIGANLQPLALQPDGSVLGSANLSRDLTYYNNSFGTQTLQMDSEATDPAMYLQIAAAFWPYLSRIGYFAPALVALASETADQVAPPAKPPLVTLASLQAYDPVQTFVTNSIALVGPALGPFAASFIPPNDSGNAPWIAAARWCGWVLMHGAGSPNLTSAFTAQYEYFTSIVPPAGGGGASHKLPIYKAPSANLTPASQINDLLGR
jgi:hypothetical protein